MRSILVGSQTEHSWRCSYDPGLNREERLWRGNQQQGCEGSGCRGCWKPGNGRRKQEGGSRCWVAQSLRTVLAPAPASTIATIRNPATWPHTAARLPPSHCRIQLPWMSWSIEEKSPLSLMCLDSFGKTQVLCFLCHLFISTCKMESEPDLRRGHWSAAYRKILIYVINNNQEKKTGRKSWDR